MKTLRKTLALVLVLALSVSFFAFSASATSSYNSYTDKDTINYKDAVSILSGLGIIEGFEDGSFQPTGNVTRAQMAKLIAYALLGADDADALTASADVFTDVPANHWAAGYIQFCVNMGIIDGYGDGTYGPNDNVTGYQVAKLLLCAIGYGQNNEYTGANWSSNVSKKALALDLFDSNVGGLNGKPATREEACLYLWNALNIQTVTYDTDDGYTGLTYKDSNSAVVAQTLGHKNYNIEVSTPAQVVANGSTTSAYKVSSTNTTGTSFIGNKTYKIDTGLDLIGHFVKVYSDSTDSSKVYAVVDKTKVCATVTIPTVDSTVTDQICTLLRSNGFSVDANAKDTGVSVTVSDNYGKFNSTSTLAKLTVGKTYIFLSDSSSDKTPLYAISIDEKLFQVSKNNSNSEALTLDTPTGGSMSIDYSDIVSDPSTLAVDDYVVGVQVNDLYWSFTEAKTVSGAVTSYNPTKSTITIDGTKYNQSAAGLTTSLDDSAINLSDITKSDIDDENSMTLYLDSAGNFMMVLRDEASANNSVIAAYDGVYKLAADKNGYYNTNAYVKGYTLDGTAVTYETKDDVDTAHESNSDFNGYTDNTIGYYKVAVDSDGIATLTAIASTGIPAGGSTYYANSVDTAVTVKDDATSISLGANTVGATGSTATKVYVNSSTNYLFIYKNSDGDDKIDVVTGGINATIPTTAKIIATKSGNNYIAKAVIFGSEYENASTSADHTIYFNSAAVAGYNGYYTYTGYDCSTGTSTTYAIDKVDSKTITTATITTAGVTKTVATIDNTTELTLDGFYTFTLSNDVYSLTSKGDTTTYVEGAGYDSYYGKLLTFTVGNTTLSDYDFTDAVVVDTRSASKKVSDFGFYKYTITSVSDIDAAVDAGYNVVLNVLTDTSNSNKDILAIFVSSAASTACAISVDGVYCTAISGSTVTVAANTTANNLTVSNGATITVKTAGGAAVDNTAALASGNVITVTAKDGVAKTVYTVA